MSHRINNFRPVVLIIPLIAALCTVSGADAQDKNPCMAKNPCAAKVTPIRANPVTEPSQLEDLGEKLWTDKTLGRSGLSCSTCHADGALLKRTPFPKYIKMAEDTLTLDQMINFCMMNPMKAEPLPWN